MVVFSIQYLTAQVRIGGNTAPDDFAALQLDGVNQGLRLSRLDNSQRTALNVEGNKEAAKGLVIYNTESGNIEFYDGTSWRTLNFTLPAKNGVSWNTTTGKIELGGNLIESTTIEQEANKMTFNTGTGGYFNVNGSVFSVRDTYIWCNNDNFTVKNGTNDVFKIGKNGTAINHVMNVGTSSLDVNSGVFNVAGTRTTIAGNLKYEDTGATYGTDKVLMSKDNTGEAYWGTLTPETTSQSFTTISTREGTPTTRPSSSQYLSSSFTAITNTINLTAGKWIVSGMLYTYTYNQKTNDGHTYIAQLRLYRTSGTAKALYITGDQLEYKNTGGTSLSGGAFSAIPMTCFIEVPVGETWTVRIDASTETSNTYLIKNYSWLNPNRGSSFKATRVND